MSVFAQTLTILCAVGAGTAAGAFFTFSTFTMEGLKRLSPAQGAAASKAVVDSMPPTVSPRGDPSSEPSGANRQTTAGMF